MRMSRGLSDSVKTHGSPSTGLRTNGVSHSLLLGVIHASCRCAGTYRGPAPPTWIATPTVDEGGLSKKNRVTIGKIKLADEQTQDKSAATIRAVYSRGASRPWRYGCSCCRSSRCFSSCFRLVCFCGDCWVSDLPGCWPLRDCSCSFFRCSCCGRSCCFWRACAACCPFRCGSSSWRFSSCGSFCDLSTCDCCRWILAPETALLCEAAAVPFAVEPVAALVLSAAAGLAPARA
jgi:hypothetical protein